MLDPIVIQAPASATLLVLLFHGVGSTSRNMIPLGQLVAASQPAAVVISVPSPDACDLGAGYQWFSVRGISESDRPQRVAATMQRFVATIEALQAAHGLTAAQTVLIGFSQGGIMALEASQVAEPPARSIVAMAGRFGQLPSLAPRATSIHLIHGSADTVVATANSVAAAERLRELGADVTLDLIPLLGHGIDEEAAKHIVTRLAGDFGKP